MELRFQPEATAELVEALTWYGLQGEELDRQLMLRIDEVLQRIIEAPDAFPTVYRHVRRAVVRQFPFAIFYVSNADEIRVLAVFHSRRDPRDLKSRD